MKILLLLFAGLVLQAGNMLAQDPEKASKLVDEGIVLHDAQNYEGAIAKYDEALAANKDDFYALAEKAMSLFQMDQLDAAISLSEYTLKKYAKRNGAEQVYITLGNALDDKGRPEEAIDVYQKGIQARPGAYLLYYNMAISYARLGKDEKVESALKTALLLYPSHASSNYILGILMAKQGKRIPSILTLMRFLALEPSSNRSTRALGILTDLMAGHAEKTGRRKITINFDPQSLEGKDEADYFGPVEVLLDVTSALDLDRKNRKKEPVSRFLEKIDELVKAMEELQKEQNGYFWENFVPFFVKARLNGHLESMVYLTHLSRDDKYVSKWVKTHKNAVIDLLEWMHTYKNGQEQRQSH